MTGHEKITYDKALLRTEIKIMAKYTNLYEWFERQIIECERQYDELEELEGRNWTLSKLIECEVHLSRDSPLTAYKKSS